MPQTAQFVKKGGSCDLNPVQYCPFPSTEAAVTAHFLPLTGVWTPSCTLMIKNSAYCFTCRINWCQVGVNINYPWVSNTGSWRFPLLISSSQQETCLIIRSSDRGHGFPITSPASVRSTSTAQLFFAWKMLLSVQLQRDADTFCTDEKRKLDAEFYYIKHHKNLCPSVSNPHCNVTITFNYQPDYDLLTLTAIAQCIHTVFSSRVYSVWRQLRIHYCLNVNDFKRSTAQRPTIKIPWRSS